MSVRIKTDDGALGKKLSGTRKKVNDAEVYLCETAAQMNVTRRQAEELAGVPDGFFDGLYSEEGMPVADMSILFIKRELRVTGTFRRGEEQYTAELKVNKAAVSNVHFKLEPNGAVFICKLAWEAAGDELERARYLCGQWCSVDLTFRGVDGTQQNLNLQKNGEASNVTPIESGLPARLRSHGIEISGEDPFWTEITPAELSKILKYADELDKVPQDEADDVAVPKVLAEKIAAGAGA